MNFRFEESDRIFTNADHFVITNDAGVCVAHCEQRAWAQHITKLLNADGSDVDPIVRFEGMFGRLPSEEERLRLEPSGLLRPWSQQA